MEGNISGVTVCMDLLINARGRSVRAGDCIIAGSEQKEGPRFLVALGIIAVREIMGRTTLVSSREYKPGMRSRQGQQEEDNRFPIVPFGRFPAALLYITAPQRLECAEIPQSPTNKGYHNDIPGSAKCIPTGKRAS